MNNNTAMDNDNLAADSKPMFVPINIWDKDALSSSEPVPTKVVVPKAPGSLLLWSVLPMLLWFAAANGLAYYFTSQNYWQDVRQHYIAMYAMMTLYAVPGVLTIITGFMVWGYALRVHGVWVGTAKSLGLFVWQWLVVSGLIYASVHWHYVYFYIQQAYS